MLKNNFINKSGIFTSNKFLENTNTIKKFYKNNPFPNYKNQQNKASLVDNANKNIFLKKLKKSIGYNKKILEVGSGTCQLSNYLAIGTNNICYALDPTLESLKLGKKFALENKIENVNFINADLFDDIFDENVFDVVICTGVLHHTADPRRGFENILRYLKKDGYIIVGLYNKIGRIRTNIRQFIYKYLNRGLAKFLDPYLRSIDIKDVEKSIAWIKDQYEHPIESSHSFDELLEWFNNNKVEFINVFPNELLDTENKDVFENISKNDKFERVMQQILMLFSTTGGEGGLFVMVGKK